MGDTKEIYIKFGAKTESNCEENPYMCWVISIVRPLIECQKPFSSFLFLNYVFGMPWIFGCFDKIQH